MDKQCESPAASTSTEADIPIAQLEAQLAACQEQCHSLENERAEFELFTDSMWDLAMVALDVEGRVTRWYGGAERLLGWSAEEMVGQPSDKFYTPEDALAGLPQRERSEATARGYIREESWHVRRDGTRFFSSGSLAAVRNEAGELVGFAKVMRDMTDRQEAQERLRESEERLRLFIENVTDYALLQVDRNARISSWNTGAERTFRYKEDEIIGRPMRTLYMPDEAERGDAEKDLEAARENGRFEDARWLVRKDGTKFFGRWVTTPVKDQVGNLRGYAKVLRDETERRNAEQQMRASLAEKQALLQEIHHRVKNNLQVITSLLSIQAARIENADVSTVLADTENRVRAIAALHETLYSSRDLASIEFGTYVDRLVRDLVGFYAVDQKRLNVAVRAADLVVDIGQAIPLGLIVNELVTNTLKHAFPDGRLGTVDVQLEYLTDTVEFSKGDTLDDGLGQLTVTDNGTGLPPDFNFEETPSMGLHLVNVLVEQLQGELEVRTGNGTSIAVKFPLSIGS